MKETTTYNRKAVFAELSQFSIASNEGAFIEVTEWKNGEGFDVCIDNSIKTLFQITYSDYRALKKLVKILDK